MAKLDSLLRIGFLARAELPYPQQLLASRFSRLSPAGEDGIVGALATVCGLRAGARCLELGLPPRARGTILGATAMELGFHYLAVDGDDRRLSKSRLKLGLPSLRFHQLDPTAEDLLSDAIGGDVDVLAVSGSWGGAGRWERLTELEPTIVAVAYEVRLGVEPVLVLDPGHAGEGRAEWRPGRRPG